MIITFNKQRNQMSPLTYADVYDERAHVSAFTGTVCTSAKCGEIIHDTRVKKIDEKEYSSMVARGLICLECQKMITLTDPKWIKANSANKIKNQLAPAIIGGVGLENDSKTKKEKM